MGVGTLLRRRLLTHPVALVAVATSVPMSMVVVVTLQLLSSAIAGASLRTTLEVSSDQRSVALTVGVRRASWPAPPGDDVAPGAGALEVVLPGAAATALGARVGTRLALVDLVDDAAKPLEVVVTGTYEPTGVADGLWVDDPLGLAGVGRSDYTTYGPFATRSSRSGARSTLRRRSSTSA